MKIFLKLFAVILVLAMGISAMTSCTVRKIDEDIDSTLVSSTDVAENEPNDTDPEETTGPADTTDAEGTDKETDKTTEPATEKPETEKPVTDAPETKKPETEKTETQKPETEKPETQKPETDAPATEAPETKPVDVPTETGDCLFIGDSRTVGLQLYSGMKVDYFANVGMSIYNIGKTSVEVGSMGNLSFDALMAKKQYKRIFIMLGINEIGYPHASTAAKYKELIDSIKVKQPDACIFVQANIHVTKERSDKDSVINNANLNAYNAYLAKLADNSRVFYLDANFLFDDASGNLSAEKTSDGVHFYAKDYIPWANWLLSESQKLMK